MDADPGQPERPPYAAAITEDLLMGYRRLRQGFMQSPMRYAVRGAPIVRLDHPEPAVILIRNGFAFRSSCLPDRRRAILDIVVPGDFVGLDHLVLAHPIEEITAASQVGYNAVTAANLRELLKNDRSINMHVLTTLAEGRWRTDRLIVSIGRFEAAVRICIMLLDVYDRLRRRELISRPIFNLPLTQEQMADHLGLTLIHVNRILRRLRQERIVAVDRGVVIIMDLDRLREIARGLPAPTEPSDMVDRENQPA